MLYQHNATVYLAGRSADKAEKAVASLKQAFPNSKGSVDTIIVDFSDLTTIKPALDKFTAVQKEIHVLTLNHGIMFTPEGSKGAQGFDLQLVTNCIGSYLFYKLLQPTLAATAAKAPAGSVRVTWASSTITDLLSPKPGGVKFEADGAPSQTLEKDVQYGQTKAGNTILAGVLARHDKDAGIFHYSWNPGNLASDLSRHMSAVSKWVLSTFVTFPVRFGGYTELWAAVAEIPPEKNGAYIAPWGRLWHVRDDIQKGIDDTSPEAAGEKFVKWLDDTSKQYA